MTPTEAAIDQDAIDFMIIEHQGDMRAALEAAMLRIAELDEELTMAGLAMSYGFARGRIPGQEPQR